MTISEYNDIWVQTGKAAAYLRGKGARYHTIPVASGCGDLRLVRYTFADVSAKARDHVAKAYPSALVAFADPADVEREIQRIDAAFMKAVARA